MGDVRYRVYNKCRYAIGVRLLNGTSFTINPNSFQMLTADDILYIESCVPNDRFFGTGKLCVTDREGKTVDISELGIVAEEGSGKHMEDNDIEDMLKGSAKKMEAWLNDIDDPSELYSIYEIAKTIDLPSSKLKILNAKMPDKDLI